MSQTSVAQLLATQLADDRVWATPSGGSRGLEARKHLASSAIRLYEATGPVFAEADRDDDDHFSQAVWVIRDIADRCAVLSKEWDAKEFRRWVYVPDRESVEESIRGADLVRWADGLGYPLSLHTPEGAYSPNHGVGWLLRVKTSRRRVADEFVAVESRYRQIQEIRRSEGADWFKTHTSAMRASAVFIAEARNDLVWAATMDDGGAVVVAEALLLAAQGMFVATHTSGSTDVDFPTTDFLREFLRRKGGDRWLTKHLKRVPDWLEASLSQSSPTSAAP